MASADLTNPGKVRSRKDGAARPLEDVERKLLNLLQGSFPLEPRPFARVAERMGAAKSLGRVPVGTDARVSITPKRSYWRATLADGSTVQLAAEPKGDGKTTLNVTHMKLGTEADVARWRAFWKDELGKF